MKITSNTQFETPREVPLEDVLQFFLDRAENRGEGSRSRRRYRAEALEGVVSRLIVELVQSRVLRGKDVDHIFDYDVATED